MYRRYRSRNPRGLRRPMDGRGRGRGRNRNTFNGPGYGRGRGRGQGRGRVNKKYIRK